MIVATPIYLFFALLAIALTPHKTDPNRFKKSDVFRSSFVPLAVVIVSVEGMTDTTSFPREEQITRTHVLKLTPEEIHANLTRPIHLDAKRNAFLSLFPLPERIETPTFTQGTTHKAFFTYRRWGFTNIHRGETQIRFKKMRH